MALYRKMPPDLITGDMDRPCPFFVVLGEALILFLLLYGICEYEVDTVKAVPFNDWFYAVMENMS